MKKKSYFENFKKRRVNVNQSVSELEKQHGFIAHLDKDMPLNMDTSVLWECKSGHKFRATTRYLSRSPKCTECINAEHNVTIDAPMIKQVLESMTGKSFNEFKIVNPDTGRQIGIHGYSPDLRIGFQFIRPQDHVFIKGLHKDIDEVIARKELIAKKKKIVEDIPGHLILVYFEMPKDKLQAYIEKCLDEYGVDIISRDKVNTG